MIYLGVDPGVINAGFSILSHKNNQTVLLDCGFAKMSSKDPIHKRLDYLYNFFNQKIIDWQVTDIVLETPFLGKNAQNFLKLGYVRGILYLLASQSNLTLHEFSPRELKLALTGYGAAQKIQVSNMIYRLFPGIEKNSKFDVTDAVALSLCALWTKSKPYSQYRKF
jgi:crossover junction endodeoxyribonuclease RuvC